jgi:hypothetical protein
MLKQPNKDFWREHPPKVLRGDMKEAFDCAAGADKLECDCWNTACPYYGDCRKCLVFHLCLKQFPTCQRDLLRELHVGGLLDEELHIEKTPEA